MARRGHIDEMKARRALQEAQKAEAARISRMERPDPARMAMTQDFILVRIKLEQQTEAGIVLPEGVAQEFAGDGTVEAVGPGWWCQGSFIEMRLKVGDEVLIARGAQLWPMPADRTLCACKETDVMAVLKPKTSILQVE